MTKLTAISMIVNGKRTVFFANLPVNQYKGDIQVTIDSRNYDNMMAIAGAKRGDTVTTG